MSGPRLGAGFEVGDHTETHPFMPALPAAAQRAEIVDAGEAIERDGAPFPDLRRPPYGAFNAATLAIVRALKMVVVLWTVDTSDYARPGVARTRIPLRSRPSPAFFICRIDVETDRRLDEVGGHEHLKGKPAGEARRHALRFAHAAALTWLRARLPAARRSRSSRSY